MNDFSGEQQIITVPKIYVSITGDYQTAILLNRIIFWSDRTKGMDGYFHKTYDEWEKELLLSKYQVSRCVKALKKLGLVETKTKKANGSPTIHYKINMETLVSLVSKQEV